MNTGLKGLVLAGGKSTRMGLNKAAMNWHGKEQQYFLADLMSSCCEEVFISCREDQTKNVQSLYKTIPDRNENSGPFEAILTAFEKHPNCGWLVLACDLPLMDLQTLHLLQDHRDRSKIATAFESPVDGLPEPLAAIWEPKIHPILKSYHQKKHLPLRKILLENGAKTIKAPHKGALINVNTPEDAERIREILAKRSSI